MFVAVWKWVRCLLCLADPNGDGLIDYEGEGVSVFLKVRVCERL